MPINITMPALSPTMEEGNLAKWLVKEGDKIKSGDIIAEIETDKATMEVEAVDEGVIAKIMVAAGSEGVKVNTVIAVLAVDGEDVGAAASGATTSKATISAALPPISPSQGEMSARPTEGALLHSSAPVSPSVTPRGDISPQVGRLGAKQWQFGAKQTVFARRGTNLSLSGGDVRAADRGGSF